MALSDGGRKEEEEEGLFLFLLKAFCLTSFSTGILVNGGFSAETRSILSSTERAFFPFVLRFPPLGLSFSTCCCKVFLA